LDVDEQFAYQQDLKARLDYKNVMDYAKEEAEKKGMEKGRLEGEKAGREEEKIALAKELLDVLDIEVIAQKTGLSIERIKKTGGM
jgi:predicted transposase/invertase (TIGR01784 family)